jgi:hypothetical protein
LETLAIGVGWSGWRAGWKGRVIGITGEIIAGRGAGDRHTENQLIPPDSGIDCPRVSSAYEKEGGGLAGFHRVGALEGFSRYVVVVGAQFGSVFAALLHVALGGSGAGDPSGKSMEKIINRRMGMRKLSTMA